VERQDCHQRQSVEALKLETALAKQHPGRRPSTEPILKGVYVQDDQHREEKVSCDNDGFWFEEEGTVSCKDNIV